MAYKSSQVASLAPSHPYHNKYGKHLSLATRNVSTTPLGMTKLVTSPSPIALSLLHETKLPRVKIQYSPVGGDLQLQTYDLQYHRDKGTLNPCISGVPQVILTSCILYYPCKFNYCRDFFIYSTIIYCAVYYAPVIECEKCSVLIATVLDHWET
jgi:hypothetical protein